MTTRYRIVQLDTGLNYNDGAFCEEPEWFSSTEATHIMRTSPLAKSDPSAWAIRSCEFSYEEGEV
jgi:hypothetical protein